LNKSRIGRGEGSGQIAYMVLADVAVAIELVGAAR